MRFYKHLMLKLIAIIRIVLFCETMFHENDSSFDMISQRAKSQKMISQNFPV